MLLEAMPLSGLPTQSLQAQMPVSTGCMDIADVFRMMVLVGAQAFCLGKHLPGPRRTSRPSGQAVMEAQPAAIGSNTWLAQVQQPRVGGWTLLAEPHTDSPRVTATLLHTNPVKMALGIGPVENMLKLHNTETCLPELWTLVLCTQLCEAQRYKTWT